MDVYVLLDAIAKCMSSEEKELCKIGELALNMTIEVGNNSSTNFFPHTHNSSLVGAMKLKFAPFCSS